MVVTLRKARTHDPWDERQTPLPLSCRFPLPIIYEQMPENLMFIDSLCTNKAYIYINIVQILNYQTWYTDYHCDLSV